MKAIIDFVKTNLPIIAAVLAFGVAAVIGAYLIVRYVKNKKKNAEKPSVTDENFTTKPETEEITRADENGADDLVAATDTQEENSMKDIKTETAKTTKSAPKAEEKKPMKTAARRRQREMVRLQQQKRQPQLK